MRAGFKMLVVGLGLLFVGAWLLTLGPGSAREAEAARVERADERLTTPERIEAAVAAGTLDRDTADLYLAYALLNAEKLPAAYRSPQPWDGTLPLLQLQRSVGQMAQGETRATVERLLTGVCSDSTNSLPNVLNSSHYHIEYGAIGGGLTIAEYSASLETTWTQEITTFGWAAPPVLASNPPPGNRYHVRIDDLGSGLYGFVSSQGSHAGFVGNNPNTGWDDSDAYASCMVLNNNFTGFPGSPQRALDATTAHEFNHSIQFGYGGLGGSNAAESVFVEGGATWMEDEVFDASNDNYNYLWPNFTMCMGEYTASPYPYWIVLRGLTERYGVGSSNAGEQIMQDFWEETSQGTGDNLSAINSALVNRGTTLASAYHDAAIAMKFNKSCGGGYGLPYCFEEGASYVASAGQTTVHGTIASVGGNSSGTIQDHYALNWIQLPAGGSNYNITLHNTSGGGQIRGSIVCDTGSSLTVQPFAAIAGPGATTTLTGFNPGSCTQVVAVLTNHAHTSDNPSSCAARSYILSTSTGGPTPTATATLPPGTAQNFYLPLALRAEIQAGIAGRVTLNGASASGSEVRLRQRTGSSAWATVATATTESDGSYKFRNVATLGSGQQYRVEYFNDALSSGRLFFWATVPLSSYTNGTDVTLTPFDIGDVRLREPDGEAHVSLPATFIWTRRAATPSDSYVFEVYDPVDPDVGGATNELGYVEGVIIGGLPGGFESDHRYVWDVVIVAPDDSFGISLEARGVYFNNALMGQPTARQRWSDALTSNLLEVRERRITR